MLNSNLEPIFVLQALHEDDTINTLCHWHYIPEQHEIDEMTATYHAADVVQFFVSLSNVVKRHVCDDAEGEAEVA